MAIQLNFDEVPDKVEPIKPGLYDLTIEEATIEEVKGKPGKQKLVVKHKIHTEGAPDHGREISNHISLEMKTTLKNLYHSATGQRPGAGGFNEAELVGKICKARLEADTYKTPEGQTRQVTRVAEYVIPA